MLQFSALWQLRSWQRLLHGWRRIHLLKTRIVFNQNSEVKMDGTTSAHRAADAPFCNETMHKHTYKLINFSPTNAFNYCFFEHYKQNISPRFFGINASVKAGESCEVRIYANGCTRCRRIDRLWGGSARTDWIVSCSYSKS